MLGRFFDLGKHRRLRLLLSSYVDGELREGETKRVEEHLATCEECRWELDSLRATVDLLRKVPSPVPSRSFTLREEPSPLSRMPGYLLAMRASASVAALLLIALLAGDFAGLLSQGGAVTREVTPPVTQEALQSAAPAPTPAPMPAGAPMAPIQDATPEIVIEMETEITPEQIQEDEAKRLGVGGEIQEPVVPGDVPEEKEGKGLSLPLWQLEVALGGGLALMGATLLWMILRRRQRYLT